jgi:hypothetical protein
MAYRELTLALTEIISRGKKFAAFATTQNLKIVRGLPTKYFQADATKFLT